MAKKYRKLSKASRRAFTTRGGFGVTPPPRTGGRAGSTTKPLKPMRPTQKNVGRSISQIVRRHFGTNARAYRMALAAAAGATGASIKGNLAGKEYGVGEMPDNGLFGAGYKMGSTERVESKVGNKHESSLDGVVHKTSFTCGQPPTRSVVDNNRQHGTKKLVWYDTMVQVYDNVSDRESLVSNTGFNQKQYVWFQEDAEVNQRVPSYWTLNDMDEIFGMSDVDQTGIDNYNITSYINTHHFGTKATITNINTYLKLKVKCYWVSCSVTNRPAYDALKACFNGTTALQEDGAIPKSYQLTSQNTSGMRNTVGVDPQLGSLGKSDSFLNDFKVIKTMSKTLMPGDDWIIDHKFETGPGLRYDKLIGMEQGTDSDYDPFMSMFYMPIFEIQGTMVECIDSQNSNVRYSGTAPGSVMFQFKKYAEYGLRPKSQTGAGIYPNLGVNFRLFLDSPTLDTAPNSPRFSVPYADILNQGDSPAAGKYIIPGTTDVDIIRAGKAVS